MIRYFLLRMPTCAASSDDDGDDTDDDDDGGGPSHLPPKNQKRTARDYVRVCVYVRVRTFTASHLASQRACAVRRSGTPKNVEHC